MKEEDIDRLFREAFHEAEETPNQNVWQRIERELDESKKKTVRLPWRKQIWVRYVAAAILLLAATFGLLKLSYKSDTQSPDGSETIVAKKQENNQKYTTIQHSENTEQVQIATDKNKEEKIHRTDIVLAIQPQRVEKQKSYDRVNVDLKIGDLEESKPKLLNLKEVQEVYTSNIPVHQVIEIEDIKPLIDLDEETESMYAQAPHETANKNVVTSILNTISEKIEVSTTKDIRFRADEEGSLRIDILNSFVKNRNKKNKR
ncbi:MULTISPECIES: hypothetical protein [Sphingobacterium]|uniref:hypothetical protein n=1 Tax=Sphingobacterium TaxID=28453 RepID=UPI0013D96828|nr:MULTISPECIES: hypothetical protein [unclassified Sphingobacterium]